MKQRVLSGLLMLPLFILVVFGDKVLLVGCFIIGVMGVREFFNGFNKMGIKPSFVIACVSAVALYAIEIFRTFILATGMWPMIRFLPYKLYMLWFVGVVVASLLYLFNVKERKLEDGAITMMGIFYVIFLSYHVALTELNYGIMVWLIFLTAFGTDVMAYFTGYVFGKHKLCPTISPKKTIEGAIGGVLGSVILCGIFGYFFAYEAFWPNMFIHCMVIGALGGVVSQFGDLTASVFKRKMGIKDYGNLIPGHGGVLDRFDSVLFTAPLVYYYI
ncbi:MAG: phosphatidate cytidylyltransferase, partial [Clostridiales bacterium]|nr:phosphatidate cytidylyltransferase [Clostridiales bacterium]